MRGLEPEELLRRRMRTILSLRTSSQADARDPRPLDLLPQLMRAILSLRTRSPG
jgi:hypothetical protein